MKGQSQIIIVFAIMIFVVVVIIFAFQRGIIFPADESVYELKKGLEAEIENMIAGISSETIRTVGKNGGYLVPSAVSASLGENDVAYWQICQNNMAPKLDTIEQSISNGIESKLNLEKIDSFQGKNVVVGDVEKVDVSVRKDDILVRVWMPVSIDDTPIDQQFEIVLPIELGRAYDFASSFANDNVAKRHISTFIASLLYHSPNTYLPTTGLLTKCGESIVVTYDEAKERVNNILNYVGSNTVFWENEPSNTDYLKYYIPDVMGKEFSDLEISFRHTGNLNTQNFQPSMNPIVLVNSKTYHRILPICSLAYDVRYNIMPSFVVSAKTKSGFEFNFGVQPFVKNSRIGECTGVDGLVRLSNICADAKCDALVTVKDSDNLPIRESSVIYGSCNIGKTDEKGVVSGKIPCGIAPLIVSNPSYIPQYDVVSSFDLSNKEVVLEKAPPIKIHFYRALVDNDKISFFGMPEMQLFFNILGTNSAPATNEDVIVTMKQKDKSPWSTFEAAFSNKQTDGEVKDVLSVDYIPPGKYEFQIESFKKIQFYKKFCVKKYAYIGPCSDYQTINEQIIVPTKIKYDFEIKEGIKDIYITAMLPNVATVSETPEDIDYTKALGSIMNCLVPVSETPPKSSCRI